MKNKDMKRVFEQLNPTREQQNRMKQKILERAKQEKVSGKNKVKHPLFFNVMKVAVAMCGILIVVNFATGGKVVDAMKYILYYNQGKQDVVGQAEELKKRGIEIYAPEVLYLDEDTLVFGTLRGLILYNRKEACVKGTVDLQAIDCIYFQSEKKATHVLVEGDSLIVFNSEQEKPLEPYYLFDLTKTGDGELEPVEASGNQEALQQYYAAWVSWNKQYVDTFDTFDKIGLGESHIHPNDIGMYSLNSLCQEGQYGKEISYLTMVEDVYTLNTYMEDTGEVKEEKIDLSATQDMEASGSETEVELPQFEYAGEDKVVGAICDYFARTEASLYESGQSVWIPGFVIYQQVAEGDEILVFGNFWSYTYLLNGNILESESGGEKPACVHLKEQDGTYRVTAVDAAGDGADYDKDIREFTKNYPSVYEQFQASGETDDRQENQKAYLKMYIENNDLDIEYYKEYGWDPIKIK